MGLFITLEGIEGCGKSTQVRLLSEALKERGLDCAITREPGGTPIGGKIREILLNPDHKGMAPEAELLLYAADRAQHVREVIKPSIDGGKVVICDRFTDATLAYQGFGRGLDMALINELNRIASLGIRPDLTLLLDCPVEMGIKRAVERNSKRGHIRDDRFEREALGFHRRVRDGYLAIAEKEPERVKVMDASRDVETVHREIWRFVSSRVVE
jgi:dTMP kinase